MFYDVETYLNRSFPQEPTFIDVGANKGQWIEKMITQYPQCLIYAFEPIPRVTPSYQNVQLINCAIDIHEEKSRVFYITADNVTSSLLQLNDRVTNNFVDFTDDGGLHHKKSDFDVISIIRVETQRLDNFIFANDIPKFTI